MTFYRITKPLTALALCALLCGAGIGLAANPSWAQDEIQNETALTDGDEIVSEGDAIDTAAIDDEGADDDMPPMAEAHSAPLPPLPDTAAENLSRLPPNFKQMQAIRLDEVGPSNALDKIVPRNATATDGKPYVEPVGETHPPLYLTPDKSTIIRLENAASAVLVGNEAHVNVLIDTPTTLVAVPRQPGASYFTVLDEQRRIVMRRHVIVGPAPQYVRVRRSCANVSGACNHTSVFYCPEGMCHPVHTMQNPGTAPNQNTAAFTGPGGGGMTSGEDYGMEPGTVNGTPSSSPSALPFPFFPIPYPVPTTTDNND